MGAMNPAVSIPVNNFVNPGILLAKPSWSKRIPALVDQLTTDFAKVILHAFAIKRPRKKTENNCQNNETKND